MVRFLRTSFAIAVVSVAPDLAAAQAPATPEVLIRLDDAGMNHSVNVAIEKVIATGMPVSVSVLFAAPMYQEAVDMLLKHPEVAVGVHLALNSEWRDYRWGPVLGKAQVKSLVDATGNFLPSREGFLASRFDYNDVEVEITAQIERAIASGLRITYVDAHMGTLEATPELRALEARVARRYGLGVSKSFGESYFTLWDVPVAAKKSALLTHLGGLKPDAVNMVVVHVAERTPEMEVLFDANAPAQNAPDAGVAAHRSAELAAMLSPELADAVRARKFTLITYQQLIARAGRR